MLVDTIEEPAASAWTHLLDAAEKARGARYVFVRDRATFLAAHALMRIMLSAIVKGTDPRAWRFVRGEHGKPVAWLRDRPAPLSFNMSHTNGMVGVAALPLLGCTLGFDLEPLDRKAPLEIANRYFRPEEVAWLHALPAAERPEGFLRLWTLKEAFIKATGLGLAQNLAEFGFAPNPPRIHFTEAVAERPEDWHFEQRVIAGRFLGAVGLRRPGGGCITTEWTEIDPSLFRQGIMP